MNFAGLDKLSLVDYDEKISCVLFAKGCNFRCPFCHNSILVTKIDNNEIEFDNILEYLKERKGKIDAVVFSGGEPTLMPDLIDKISIIKSMGFLIKLDTNGTSPKTIEKLLKLNLLDYIAMDIKNSKTMYSETVGADVNILKIEESIKIIENSNIDHEYRTTIIKEFHSEKSIEDMCKMISGSKKLFLQHFVASEHCILQGLHDIKKEDAVKYKKTAEKYIQDVNLRGY